MHIIDKPFRQDQVDQLHKLLLNDIDAILTLESQDDVVKSYLLARDALSVLTQHRLLVLDKNKSESEVN